MIKKILMMMIMLGIFMISMTSAFEFDNTKTYDEKTKTITIENAFGLGNDVAKIKLNTPIEYKVGIGYQKVAEFELTYYKDDNGGMDLIRFYDIKNSMRETVFTFDYKIKNIEEYIVNDYELQIIGQTKNKTDIYGQIKTGTHKEKREVWNDFNEKDLIKGKTYVIGIFTHTTQGEYIEWIPKYYGVEINEWATWVASLHTNLVAYYKLDGGALEEVNGYDGVNYSAVYNSSAVLGLAFTDGTGGYINISDEDDFDFDGAFSVSIWFYTNGVSPMIISKSMVLTQQNENWYIDYDLATDALRFYTTSGGMTSNVDDMDTGWHHIVVTRDGSNDMILYVNNVSRDTANNGQDFTSPDYLLIGARRYDGTSKGMSYVDETGIWKGRALTVNEVSLLFEAPEFFPPDIDVDPTVTLNSPIDAYNSTTSLITLNCTVSDDWNLINVSSHINGTLNQTNSSGINNSNYIFQLTLADGTWNWTCEATDNESQTTIETARSFEINTTPFIAFQSPTYANATNYTTNYLPANVSLTETYFDNLTIYLYTSAGLNDSIIFTNSTRFYNFTGLADDTYYLNATVWTTTGQSNSTNETREYIIDGTAPTTNLIYPTTTNYSTAPTELNYSISDTHIDTCLYSTNATVNVTANCTGNMTGVHSVQGSNIWTIYANDTFGNENETSVTFIVDSINPAINLTYPINNTNHSIAPTELNFTVSDTNLDVCWYSTNNTVNITTSCTLNITGLSASEGENNWTIYANDTFGNENESSVTFLTDTTAPTLSAANNLTDLITFTLPVSSVWNYTVEDPHEDTCYYNTSDNATYTVETCNSSITTSWATSGSKTIQFCANDTFGFETCNTTSINVYHTSYNQSDNKDPIGEGDTAIFYFNLSVSGLTPTMSASLNFNGTSYSPDSITTGSTYQFSRSLIMQNGWGNSTGNILDWNWTYNITGIATDQITSTENITVYEVAIDNCSAYGEVILNISLKDEEANTFITNGSNSLIEIDLDLTSLSNSSTYWEYSRTWSDDVDGFVQVCVPSGLLNNSEYQIDFTIGYKVDNYVQEFFFLDQGRLNNSEDLNSLTTKNITLYDLNASDSTTFLFKFYDDDHLEVPNAIVHIFRKYIGDGIFREVERGKEDDNGETHVHLVEEDVIYYFKISLDSVDLFTSSTYNAKCLSSPCQIELEASGEFEEFNLTDWDLMEDGTYSVDSDETTRVVSLTFSKNDPAFMNLTVYKYSNDPDEISLIGTDSAYATGGTLSVTVPQVAGNTTFFAVVHLNNEQITSEWVQFEESGSTYFSGIGLSMAVLMIILFVLMGATEGIGAIIFGVFGFIVTGSLKLINLDYYALIGLCCAAAIIVIKLVKRRRG